MELEIVEAVSYETVRRVLKKNAIKPWRRRMWCIPPSRDAAFVCAMEAVLEVYKRPLDPERPLVCMDETTKQCTKEVRAPQPCAAGQPERFDVEYERNGTAHLLLFHAPLLNWRHVDIGADHSGVTWATSVARLLEEHFPDAPKVTLVMDNLSTHAGSSLYRAFEPERARALLDRLEIVYTPQARQLAEHRRDRVQRAGAPVPGSADRRPGDAGARDPCVAERAQRKQRPGALAVHDRGRPGEAGSPVPADFSLTVY